MHHDCRDIFLYSLKICPLILGNHICSSYSDALSHVHLVKVKLTIPLLCVCVHPA